MKGGQYGTVEAGRDASVPRGPKVIACRHGRLLRRPPEHILKSLAAWYRLAQSRSQLTAGEVNSEFVGNAATNLNLKFLV